QLPPFAMWPAFPASDYYGGSASLHIIGDTLPLHLCKPSPVHMLDSTHGRGCLSQSLSLLSASRRKHHGLAARFHGSLLPGLHVQTAFVSPDHTCVRRQSTSCLLSGVGRGDISTL